MKILKNSLLFCIVLLSAFTQSSCSRSDKDEGEVAPQAEYVLQEISYAMADGDKIDTVTVDLQDTTLVNTGNVLATSRLTTHFAALKKTSRFYIQGLGSLPEELKPEQFEVKVPSQWIAPNTFSYFSAKLPFSTDMVEVPYGGFTTESVGVNVPAKSKIVVTRRVDAHRINCSFTAVVQNKANGKNFSIRGKWNGLLRYDHLSTVLSEQPL